MAARQNVVDLLLRRQIAAGREWAVVQKRYGVFAVLVFQAEQAAHGFDGDEDARVGAVIAILSDFAEHADDFEPDAIQQDGSADRGASGKYVLKQLPSNDRYAPR